MASKPATTSSVPGQQADSNNGSATTQSLPAGAQIFRQQPEDLDVTRNNEATNEFQAKTIELRNQRPQWITYYQLIHSSKYPSNLLFKSLIYRIQFLKIDKKLINLSFEPISTFIILLYLIKLMLLQQKTKSFSVLFQF